MKNISSSKWKNITDEAYIAGLKEGNLSIVESFFYGLCNYTLNDIRYSLMQNTVEYDELVSELYLYLSVNNWHKLDTFKGSNGCSLRSWMVRLTWRFFMKYHEVQRGASTESIDDVQISETSELIDTEILMDVETTFAQMTNERYVQVLRWMFIEGYDAEEVASRLHLKTSNIYNIKHRAIVQFVEIFNS